MRIANMHEQIQEKPQIHMSRSIVRVRPHKNHNVRVRVFWVGNRRADDVWRQWLDNSLSAGANVYDALAVVEGAGEGALKDLNGLSLVEVLGRCQ